MSKIFTGSSLHRSLCQTTLSKWQHIKIVNQHVLTFISSLFSWLADYGLNFFHNNQTKADEKKNERKKINIVCLRILVAKHCVGSNIYFSIIFRLSGGLSFERKTDSQTKMNPETNMLMWLEHPQHKLTIKLPVFKSSLKLSSDKSAQYLDGWLLRKSRYCKQPKLVGYIKLGCLL